MIAAKAEGAHGEWLPWLETEFAWDRVSLEIHAGG
jgi:hypothetical protein